MRIVFFGLPLAALLLHHDGHEIALAVLCRKGQPGARRLRARLGADRVLDKQPTDEALCQRIERLEPDLLVSWFWTTQLPDRLLKVPRLGGIGVHPSLLPRHRGPDPTTWAILAGDTHSGVTAHRLEADYDTGDILAQEAIAIDPEWTGWDLAKALDRPSLRVLRRTVGALSRGEPVIPIPQDPAKATEAPLSEDAALALSFSAPTEIVLRHIRAFSPDGWFELGGRTVSIARARSAPCPPHLEEPAEGWFDERHALVRTLDGAVELLSVAVDGEPMSPLRLFELEAADD